MKKGKSKKKTKDDEVKTGGKGGKGKGAPAHTGPSLLEEVFVFR